MGNRQIKETINKHQELHEQIKNNKLSKNLLIFNIPITFDYARQTKSYIEQITNSSEEELNNTTFNELYLAELGIKITNNEVTFIKNNELSTWTKPEDNIEVLQTYDDNKNLIKIYKHFDWDDDPVPEIIYNHVENITRLELIIKELEKQICEEKSKIHNLEYVQSKLNKPIKEKNEYIQTIKYLMDYIYKK
jgi:hypothetical protein